MNFNNAAQAGLDASQLFLAEIRNDCGDAIVSQLVGKDGVHDVHNDTVDNIRRYRLGGPQSNRTCFALMDACGKMHVAIYVHKESSPITAPRDLCGNVRDVLHSSAEKTDKTPKSCIFYSITRMSDLKGTGEKLIRAVHGYLTGLYPDVVLSTLSPLRDSFERHLGERVKDFLSYDPELQKRMCVDFLLKGRDPVQLFHMGNGAELADVKLNADSQGACKAMVNYHYPSDFDELNANAERFKRVRRERDGICTLFSPALLEETGFSLRKAPSTACFLPPGAVQALNMQ